MNASNRFTAVGQRRAAALDKRLHSGTGAKWRQAKRSRPEYTFPEPPVELGEVEVVYVDEPEVDLDASTEATPQGDDGQTQEGDSGEIPEGETPKLTEVEKGVRKIRVGKGGK